MTVPNLGDLPIETVHQILTGLNLRDQCHLRLVNRSLQWKVTDVSFRERFRCKTLDMTRKSLTALITATEPGRLGCLIKHLTIRVMVIEYTSLAGIVKTGKITRRQLCGFIDMTCEDSLAPWERVKLERDLQHLTMLRKDNDRMFESNDALILLVKVLKNIKDNSVGKGLIELSTEVICIRDDPSVRLSPEYFLDISQIWDASAKLYQVLISALMESKMPVEDLLLYSAESSITCSLSRNQVMFPSFNKLDVLATNLRCLSISISAPCRDKSDTFNQYEECQEGDDFDGLNTLIASLPGLKILDIHYYTLEGNRPDPIPCNVNPSLLSASFNWEQYSTLALERMSLRGAVLREIDLLSFLQRNKVLELRLDNVRLEEGSFQSVFDFCTRSDSLIQRICCRDLYEDLMISFLGDHSNEAIEHSDEISVIQERRTTLFRTGNSIRLPIIYSTMVVSKRKTIRDVQYLGSIEREFGPPYWLNRDKP